MSIANSLGLRYISRRGAGDAQFAKRSFSSRGYAYFPNDGAANGEIPSSGMGTNRWLEKNFTNGMDNEEDPADTVHFTYIISSSEQSMSNIMKAMRTGHGAHLRPPSHLESVMKMAEQPITATTTTRTSITAAPKVDQIKRKKRTRRAPSSSTTTATTTTKNWSKIIKKLCTAFHSVFFKKRTKKKRKH